MLHLSLEVIVEAFSGHNSWRIQDLPLHFGHLVIKLDLPLFEFFLPKDFIDKFDSPVEPILRIFDFVAIDRPHLIPVTGEIVG